MPVVVAALGLIMGSFCNVLIYRLPRRLSLVLPRSHCPHCKRTLTARELVPLFSFAWQRGRCLHCRKPLSWQYPVVEALTALVFLALYVFAGGGAAFWPWAALSCVLIAAAGIDLKWRIIPNRLTGPGVAIGLIFALFGTRGMLPLPSTLVHLAALLPRLPALPPLAHALLGAGVGFALVWLTATLSGGMGLGDAKLLAVIGAFTGWWGAVSAFFLAALFGAVTGLLLVALGRLSRREPIPFGPFLALGAWAAIALAN